MKSKIISSRWVRWPLAVAFVAFAAWMVLQNRRYEETKQDAARQSNIMAATNSPAGAANGISH